MKPKYKITDVIDKLGEADQLRDSGLHVDEVCKRLGIAVSTLYRWRLKYGSRR